MKKLFFLLFLGVFVSCSSGNKNVNDQKQETQQAKAEVVEATINIGGMSCEMCVASVTKGVNELEGITAVNVSLEDSSAVVSYQPNKLQLAEIEKAIEKRGYTIKEMQQN